MNNEIHDDETNKLHRRNIRALAYLDRLKADDEDRERDKGGALERVSCCAAIILINAVLWWSVYQIVTAFQSSL